MLTSNITSRVHVKLLDMYLHRFSCPEAQTQLDSHIHSQ